MKLYKCISFDCEWWAYIAQELKIRFATLDELRSGNDSSEFAYEFKTKSKILNYYLQNGELKATYDEGFNSAAVLSMCKSPNEKIWNRYCSLGGVRYNFSFDASKSQDVTHKDVEYSPCKELNLCRFLQKEEKNSQFKKLLTYEGNLKREHYALSIKWNKTSATSLILKHIIDELTLKKLTRYEDEDEYRFVHLLKPVQGANQLQVQLKDQKVDLGEIGLTLDSISTNDIEYVRQNLPVSQIPIESIDFQ
jgi:hypothetical protein